MYWEVIGNHKITVFWLLSPLLLHLELSNVLRGHRNPYTASLESWSDLPPPPPPLRRPLGQTGVLKSQTLCFFFVCSLVGGWGLI